MEIKAQPVQKKYKGRMKPSWITLLTPILADIVLMNELRAAIRKSVKAGKRIVPHKSDIFNAFNQHEVRECKVVILGQDPYHTVVNKRSVANGLAFATKIPKFFPPSLRNIIKKTHTDSDFKPHVLEGWNKAWGEHQANQGVLLLNTALTTEEGVAGAHTKAWQPFMKRTIELLCERKPALVWVLMGSKAFAYEPLIKNGAVLKCSHPSPLSAHKQCQGMPAFNDVDIFEQVNEILINRGEDGIFW